MFIMIPATVLIGIVSAGSLLLTLLLAFSGRSRRDSLLWDTAGAMKRLASGESGVRITIRNGYDPDGIAGAFNSMAESFDSLEKMRADFMCNVSHDMKTPMTVIHGYVSDILDGSIPSDKVEDYLLLVKKETMRLSKLLEPIIYISRLDAGDIQFLRESFDICEAARNSVIAHGEKLDAKNIDFDFSMPDEGLYVTADREAILRVFDSLLDNALTFTPEGGKIALSADKNNNSVTIKVYNEGIGIQPEDQPYVFDRFFKADRTRGFEKDSFGLGLYICRKITEAHGSQMCLESTPGKDCTFSFTLPLSAEKKRKRG